VRCPWPAAKREARLAELGRLTQKAGPDEAVFYADEMDVHLNPKVGPDWTLKGQRRLLVTPGNNKKRYVAGALNAKSDDLIWVKGISKASCLFISLAQQLASEFPQARRIHIILDNASIHSSKKTRAALADLADRVRLHFLPPYCPQGNRIERTWLDVHANVTRNHRCRNIERLMAEVDAYIQGRNEQLTPSPILRMDDALFAA
jgi:transposase